MVVSGSNVSLVVFALVGLVLPFLVDLVTKKLASGAVKQTVLLVLSLVSGVLVAYLGALNSGTAFDWVVAGTGAFISFITGVATFLGLDTTPVLGRNSVLSNPTPNFGIGKEQPVVEAPPVVANPVDAAPVVENPEEV